MKMKMFNFIKYSIVCLLLIVVINPIIVIADNNEHKILQAKSYILEFVSHPETVIFHDQCTIVEKNMVTLKFTYTNGFGIIDTLTMNIKVD